MQCPCFAALIVAIVLYDPPASAEIPLDEVIVSARRVAEPAHAIPLAVDVVPRGSLGAGNVDGLQALSARVPGLNHESFWGGIATPVIRGQAQPSAAGDNVGVFVDDIYQAGRSSLDLEAFDLERIEVLRGPQNTLFGRGTFAGAIRYVSRRPTLRPELAVGLQLGSDQLFGGQASLSGPLGASGWLGRVAYRHAEAGGTIPVQHDPDAGARRADSIVVSMDRSAGNDAERPVMITARLTRVSLAHPPSASIDAAQFNCGAPDALSGIWSFYCGELPVDQELSLSPGIPRSESEVAQVSAALGMKFGALTLRSLTGLYHSRSSAFRDFDGGDAGFPVGVCRVGVNCPPISGLPLDRFASPNVVSHPWQDATDWSQELRLYGQSGPRIDWMLGLSANVTRTTERGAFGADQGNLSADQRLTAILIGNPHAVGPLSALNAALVPDANREQRLQSEVELDSTIWSAFGYLDWHWTAASHLRVELRGARERQRRDSRVANYQPDARPDPQPIEFDVMTPRVSLDYEADPSWYAYVSSARGARSGGFNVNAGLDPAERRYEPEFNWTHEVAMRYRGGGWLGGVQTTLYYVDWRNTQILGLAATPGVSTLVTRNTAGLWTRGIELRVDLVPVSWMRAQLAWSLADPRFKAGSDDPGSRAFCGLTATPPSSTFCRYGPPRGTVGGSMPLVPWLDGNHNARASRQSGNVLLSLSLPQTTSGWRWRAESEYGWQDAVYDRGINGAWYGARGLLGLRVSVERGPWSAVLWGSNLTDRRFLRAVSGRGGAYYPSMPRPVDLLYGDGRRLGVNVSWTRGAGRR